VAGNQTPPYFQQRKHDGLVDEALRAVEDGRAHDIDWKVLIWVQVRHEMVHLVEKKSTDRVTYYTAYLQRLICVQRPELFQVPPEEPALPIQKRFIFVQRPELFQLPPDEPDQPLAIKKKRGRDRASVFGNKKHCSESDMSTAQARSKKIHSAFEKFDVASKKIDATSKKFDMQKTEERSKKIDLASKKIDATLNKFDLAFEKFAAASKEIDATSKKFDSVSKMIDATSKKFDSASKMMHDTSKKFDSASKTIKAASKMIKATSEQLDERVKQLDEKDSDMQAMDALNQALLTKERESNDELQVARKMLVEVTEQPMTPLWMYKFDTSITDPIVYYH
jgi:hypothetical protein